MSRGGGRGGAHPSLGEGSAACTLCCEAPALPNVTDTLPPSQLVMKSYQLDSVWCMAAPTVPQVPAPGRQFSHTPGRDHIALLGMYPFITRVEDSATWMSPPHPGFPVGADAGRS